jgi:Transglycosylase SLT domain
MGKVVARLGLGLFVSSMTFTKKHCRWMFSAKTALIQGFFVIGLFISIHAAANNTIYLSETADGLPHYSNNPQNTHSKPHLIVGPPPLRPKQLRADSSALLPSKTLFFGHTNQGLAQGNGFKSIAATAASTYAVPEALILAVMHAESNFNPLAVSPVGAVGLMQIMPDTGKRYGISHGLSDPITNVDVGVRYLKDLLILFKGDTLLALAAYNAGEGAVLKFGSKIPPYLETRAYVPKVMALYERYTREKTQKGSKD